jgi:hemerythrin
MIIEFDDSLVTGNSEIDSQHKELISKISDFMTSCTDGSGKVKAIKMLDYLEEYTNFHFNAEEKLQEDAGYPELANHKKQHEEFKKTIKELYEFLEDSEGPTEDFVKQVQKNVVSWLFIHIKSFDRSVAEFINLRSNGHAL